MKFTSVASTIVAQTLPAWVLSDKSVSSNHWAQHHEEDTSTTKTTRVNASRFLATTLQKEEQEFATTPTLATVMRSRKTAGLRRRLSGGLWQNRHPSPRLLTTNDTSSTALGPSLKACDPLSADVDIGILSCGESLECVVDPASHLGGSCVVPLSTTGNIAAYSTNDTVSRTDCPATFEFDQDKNCCIPVRTYDSCHFCDDNSTFYPDHAVFKMAFCCDEVHLESLFSGAFYNFCGEVKGYPDLIQFEIGSCRYVQSLFSDAFCAKYAAAYAPYCCSPVPTKEPAVSSSPTSSPSAATAATKEPVVSSSPPTSSPLAATTATKEPAVVSSSPTGTAAGAWSSTRSTLVSIIGPITVAAGALLMNE
jgi:hypothetical protein